MRPLDRKDPFCEIFPQIVLQLLVNRNNHNAELSAIIEAPTNPGGGEVLLNRKRKFLNRDRKQVCILCSEIFGFLQPLSIQQVFSETI